MDSMERSENESQEKINPPKSFEIGEVEIPESEKSALSGGTEDESLKDIEIVELWERLSMRKYLTISFMSLWTIWTFVGLTAFISTGNIFLLASSPTMMSVPILKIVAYYFRK